MRKRSERKNERKGEEIVRESEKKEQERVRWVRRQRRNGVERQRLKAGLGKRERERNVEI